MTSKIEWVRFLLLIAPFYFLVRAMVAGWKLIDEVNAAVPWQEKQYRHFGWDPVKAWKNHGMLFPDRLRVRMRVRKLYFLAMGSFAAACCVAGWFLPSK